MCLLFVFFSFCSRWVMPSQRSWHLPAVRWSWPLWWPHAPPRSSWPAWPWSATSPSASLFITATSARSHAPCGSSGSYSSWASLHLSLIFSSAWPKNHHCSSTRPFSAITHSYSETVRFITRTACLIACISLLSSWLCFIRTVRSCWRPVRPPLTWCQPRRPETRCCSMGFSCCCACWRLSCRPCRLRSYNCFQCTA